MPLADGAAFFKACRAVQAFEPRLSAELARRWPDRVAQVLAHDDAQSWLLTADAGRAIADLGNPPELWLEVLPRYAELQRGEAAHALEHLGRGVPDLRPSVLPERFEELLATNLPLDAAEVDELRALPPTLRAMAGELSAGPVPDSVDHADLHPRSVFAGEGAADAGPAHAGAADERVAGHRLRILDWGDASIAHPFFSLVVTFAFLREADGRPPDDPWFERLRDAYLEPWGTGHVELFESAQRVGAVAQALGWLRHHRAMGVGAFPGFDDQFPDVLRRAIRALRTTLST